VGRLRRNEDWGPEGHANRTGGLGAAILCAPRKSCDAMGRATIRLQTERDRESKNQAHI
jgi:hypothetical protein